LFFGDFELSESLSLLAVRATEDRVSRCLNQEMRQNNIDHFQEMLVVFLKPSPRASLSLGW